MPYGLAVSAVLLCSLLLLSSMVLAFFLALPVVVVMANAVCLLSRRTPRSAQLTRLKRRDLGVLTGTLTWNRSLLYLQIQYEAAPPFSCLSIAHAAVLQLCSVLWVDPLLAWFSISTVLSSLFVFLPLLWLFVTAPLALVASIEISRAFVEMALSLVRTPPGW
jgi:hypothetical protein